MDVRGPIRTCVGCRAQAPRSTLIRLVIDPSVAASAVVVDLSASAAGRGAWIHPQSECLDRAVNRKAIGRALRIVTPTDLDQVTAWFDQHVHENR